MEGFAMANHAGTDYRFARTSAGIVGYREYGAGTPILFVHGLLVNGSLWRKVAPLVAAHYRCIVPDWPLGSHNVPLNQGADLSPTGLARLISEFISALNLEGVTVVANDTGGALCQILITQYPERIRGLVLTDCDAFDNFLPPAFRPLQRAAQLPGVLFLIAQLMRFRAVRQLPNAFGWLAKRPIEPGVVREWMRPLQGNRAIRHEVKKVLAGISSRYTLEAARKLKGFPQPVLIAWAREDRFFPYEHAERLKALFPNARLEPVDDSFSFVPEDQPERLAELILGFVAEQRNVPARAAG
jgi:pimeloyl-ACP methyl ester carboxylesterase